jgi:hypothetical protein
VRRCYCTGPSPCCPLHDAASSPHHPHQPPLLRTNHCVPSLLRASIRVVWLQQVLRLPYQLSTPPQARHTGAPLLAAGCVGAGMDLALCRRQTRQRAERMSVDEWGGV